MDKAELQRQLQRAEKFSKRNMVSPSCSNKVKSTKPLTQKHNSKKRSVDLFTDTTTSYQNTNSEASKKAKLSKGKHFPDSKKQHLGPKVWFTGVPNALIQASKDSDEATSKSLVKATSFNGPTRAIAMDCEFVGVGYEGKENALARVSIVNQFGHTLLDEFVRPKEKITDYRTYVSGITPYHMRPNGPAKEFSVVHKATADLCNGRILVGHAVHHDLKVLMLSHPKKDIRDTAYYKPFTALFNERTPSLKRLTERVLCVDVQKGEHDSVEDARATMRLYTSVKRIWEAQIKARAKGRSQEVARLAAHLHFPETSEIGAQDSVQSHVMRPTNLAKIALDVTSEFSAGVIPSADSKTPKCVVYQSKNDLVIIGTRPKSKPVDPRGKKCSKNRARFLEKRIKIRNRKAFTSSVSTSLFS